MQPMTITAPEGLLDRVERQVPDLARRMIATFVQDLPMYRALPREQLDGEIATICRDNLRVFFRTLRERRPPAEDELAEFRVSAARRAEERVPLDAVLVAYHIGARIGWEALRRAAAPDETGQLFDVVDGLHRYIQAVTGAVATAYLEEQQAIYGEERDARRRSLTQALLTGGPTEELLSRLHMALAEQYVVLALTLDPHPDELAGGVTGPVAGRRKVRRVQARLDAAAGGPVLGLLEPSGGAVLLPCPVEREQVVLGGLPRLLHDLETAAGGKVCAAASDPVVVGDVATAASRAGEVLRLAAQLDRPPGLYRLADVLLEYQLTRPSDALPVLAGLLDPLERNPDLLLTVETYLAEDLDRRRTASALHVHPNTLDYRLRRIVELTRLEPSTAKGLQLIGAALAARRLQAADGR